MKKALFIAMAFVAITFTSCKKDWICECDGVDAYPINDARKPTAKTLCEGSTPITGNVTGCKLK